VIDVGRSIAAIPAADEPEALHVAHALTSLVTAVVVIDDGSATPLFSEPPIHVERFSHNRGYGDVVDHAISYARFHDFDTLLFVDGDGQHDVQYVAPLLECLQSADVAVGNRLHPTSPQVGVEQPAERRQANDLFRALLRTAHPSFALGDFFCGFIAFRVDKIPSELDLKGSRYASPARMWPCLLGARLRCAEIPVPRIYWSAGEKFTRQYPNLPSLGEHLFDELATACERFLNQPRIRMENALRGELESGGYEAIRPWFQGVLRPAG